MAEAPSPATTKPELPTIIIDPSIYEPEHVERPQTLITNFMRLTRVTLALTAVGGATIGVAHMLELDSLLPRAEVAALTDAFTRLTAKPGKLSTTAKQTEVVARPPIVPEPSAPAAAEAPAPSQTVPDVARAAPGTSLSDVFHAQLAGAAPAPAELPKVIAAQAQAPAEPGQVNPARPSVPVVLDKSVNKEPSIQSELRNARRLLALNQLEAAETAYRRVLEENEGEQAALTGLARVQLALGRLDLALASAKRAVDEAPEAASARLALGDILRARGDRKAAQAHYDLAAQLTPSTTAEP